MPPVDYKLQDAANGTTDTSETIILPKTPPKLELPRQQAGRGNTVVRTPDGKINGERSTIDNAKRFFSHPDAYAKIAVTVGLAILAGIILAHYTPILIGALALL